MHSNPNQNDNSAPHNPQMFIYFPITHQQWPLFPLKPVKSLVQTKLPAIYLPSWEQRFELHIHSLPCT